MRRMRISLTVKTLLCLGEWWPSKINPRYNLVWRGEVLKGVVFGNGKVASGKGCTSV